MGLCKCPKRRVTNQFCFEHRVNVCEFCMVTNHPKCIVQSYLQWLQDSDYNPICELCTKELYTEDCVRLICYHVYHWTCLNEYARQMPATTAPAGYICPSCKVGLFPAPNLVSPVADVLREKLACVNWARAGLGLPLLSDEREDLSKGENKNSVDDEISNNNSTNNENLNSFSRQLSPKKLVGDGFLSNDVNSTPDVTLHSVVHVEDSVSTFSRSENYPGQHPHKVFEALDDSKDILFDHDENKYKRRSAIEWFSRWWKSIASSSSRGRRAPAPLYRRYWMAAILFIVGLLTIIMVFSWLGRIATANDPSLDPLQNPQIRIAE